MSQMNSPSVPPTHSDFSVPAEPPGWPKVVGIISIVFGGLGIFCNVCGMVGQLASGAVVNMVPEEQREQMRQQMASVGPGQLAMYAFSVLIAIFLIIAGVMLTKRQYAARMMHIVYAVIGLLTVIIGTWVTKNGMDAQLASASLDPNMKSEQLQGMKFGMYGGLAFGVCIGLSYPLFCLVWFGLIKRTHRDMTGGFEQEPIV